MTQQATLVTTNTFIWFQFNLSHAIRHLSFGQDYPGIINPLDQTSQFSEDGRSFWCSNTCTQLLMFARILAPCALIERGLIENCKLLLFEHSACVLINLKWVKNFWNCHWVKKTEQKKPFCTEYLNTSRVGKSPKILAIPQGWLQSVKIIFYLYTKIILVKLFIPNATS